MYRKGISLSAGTQYVFDTRDLRGWYRPDTYMYLVRDNSIVAKNDDYNGYASLIAYQPSISGYYWLIIRAYSKNRIGTCDVYMKTGGGAPSRIANNAHFGGYPLDARWKSDERIETNSSSADPYIYLIDGYSMLSNDDGGPGLHSRITPGYNGTGIVVVGSYSWSTRGNTKVCNYYQSYLDNPGITSDLMDDPELILSDNHTKYEQELKMYKAKLSAMSMEDLMKITPEDIDAEVQEIRGRTLSKEEITIEEPKEDISKKLEKAGAEYDEILEKSKKKLEGLDFTKGGKLVRQIEFQKSEVFRGLIPLED